MSANNVQVGGDHYRAGIQHWDIMWMLAVPYLPGNSSKYLFRWRKKNGLQDLEKALHYAQKYAEVLRDSAFQRFKLRLRAVGRKFDINLREKQELLYDAMLLQNLHVKERSIVRTLVWPHSSADVYWVVRSLSDWLDEQRFNQQEAAEGAPGAGYVAQG